MKRNTPRVSIGLPVYNGAQFIVETLESVLAQTFTDFELIISDNASTDATEQICRAYAARDNRIRYIQQAHNIGAGRNFNYTVAQASGEYFKWVAHDDLYDPEFLQTCVSLLDRAPSSVVLCVPRIKLIDEHSKVINQHDFAAKPSLTDGARMICELRFAEVLSLLGRGGVTQIIWGLMRIDALKKTRLFIPYHSGDLVLAAELSLLGTFWQIPDYLLYMRVHWKRPARSLKNENAWWGSTESSWVPVGIKLIFSFMAVIHRADLTLWQKLCCTIQIQAYVKSQLQRHLLTPIAWRSRAGLTTAALKISRYTYIPLRLWAVLCLARSGSRLMSWTKICEVWKIPGEQLRSTLENRKLASHRK